MIGTTTETPTRKSVPEDRQAVEEEAEEATRTVTNNNSSTRNHSTACQRRLAMTR